MLTHKSQSPPLQPNYFTIFSSPRNSNLYQVWSVLRLDRFPGWMVPRLGRFQGLKVPRLEGGRVWRVANSESSRVAGNPPRVGGFQGWIVSRLDSWKTPGGFQGWSWRSKVWICWNVPRFPRLKGPGLEVSRASGLECWVWEGSTVRVARRALQDMEWCCRWTDHDG